MSAIVNLGLAEVGEGDPKGGPVVMRLGVGCGWSSGGRIRLG